MQFIQPDLLVQDQQNPQDWNRYAYVHNNPIRFNDPSGHMINECKGEGCQGDPYATVHTVPIDSYNIPANPDPINYNTPSNPGSSLASLVKQWADRAIQTIDTFVGFAAAYPPKTNDNIYVYLTYSEHNQDDIKNAWRSVDEATVYNESAGNTYITGAQFESTKTIPINKAIGLYQTNRRGPFRELPEDGSPYLSTVYPGENQTVTFPACHPNQCTFNPMFHYDESVHVSLNLITGMTMLIPHQSKYIILP